MTFSESLIGKIGREFPYLTHDPWGNRRVFLDNGTGTLILKRSAEAQYDASLRYSPNFGTSFRESRAVLEVMDRGYLAMSDWLNAGDPDTIVQAQTATSLFLQVSRAIAHEATCGNNIVTTWYEHLSDIDPWRDIERSGTIGEVRLVNLRPDGTLDMDHMRELVDDKTILVAVSATSNLLGSRTDLVEAGRIAHAAGAYYLVDGVAHLPHGHLDVRHIDCDFLVVSCYKAFSPRYTGFLYVRPGLLASMKPYTAGKGHASHRGRWQWGSPDQAKLAAVEATVDYLAALGDDVSEQYAGRFTDTGGRARSLAIAMHAIEEYERDLSRAFLLGVDGVPGVLDMPGITRYGLYDPERLDERDATFAFSIDGMTGQDAERHLTTTSGIAMRAMPYWSMAEEFFGIDLPLRASFVHYNTIDDVKCLLTALSGLTAMTRG